MIAIASAFKLVTYKELTMTAVCIVGQLSRATSTCYLSLKLMWDASHTWETEISAYTMKSHSVLHVSIGN